MSSSGPPQDDFYRPYPAPGSPPVDGQSSSAAQHGSTNTYQPYRPPGQPQRPYQLPPEAGPGGFYSYPSYYPQPPQQTQSQFVHELPGDHRHPQMPPVPIIAIQEPTPTPSLASDSRPSTVVLSPVSPINPLQNIPEQPHHDQDDDLYDAPPAYEHPAESSPVVSPVAKPGAADAHAQPPQYDQPEGTSISYSAPQEGKKAGPESSDKLTQEIGNMLISEGSTSHAESSSAAARNEPPRYDQPEGTSLEHQPIQKDKKHIESPVEAHDVALLEKTDVSTTGESVEENPPLPPRPVTSLPPSPSLASEYEKPPPLPPRRSNQDFRQDFKQDFKQDFGEDDPSNPIHYTRDPHKLIAYLIPFPKPRLHGQSATAAPTATPDRFLIYTPPPPPLTKPAEGEKETKMHKIQRKWQEEVRAAKTSTAKTASWQGVKSKATKGIDWAMSQTVSANLEFLNRIVDSPRKSRSPSPNRPGSSGEGVGTDSPGAATASGSASPSHIDPADTTEAKVGLEEMVLVYPSSIPGTPEQLRAEFINSMLRSKSKAQRDSVIATGLLPVTFAIDVLATVIWPFGGLLEIDSMWAYSSIRGAKNARSTTKRLGNGGKNSENQLKLTFTPSARLEVLQRYLAERCHERDARKFISPGVPPTETEVLEAIGWAPSQSKGETRNWEDEQWETTDVKDDFKTVMKKGAREWDNWCIQWEKDPKKALKK